MPSAGPEGMVPRLVDFGLAMSLDQSEVRLTESGMTMGTPAFAAPEHCRASRSITAPTCSRSG